MSVPNETNERERQERSRRHMRSGRAGVTNQRQLTGDAKRIAVLIPTCINQGSVAQTLSGLLATNLGYALFRVVSVVSPSLISWLGVCVSQIFPPAGAFRSPPRVSPSLLRFYGRALWFYLW